MWVISRIQRGVNFAQGVRQDILVDGPTSKGMQVPLFLLGSLLGASIEGSRLRGAPATSQEVLAASQDALAWDLPDAILVALLDSFGISRFINGLILLINGITRRLMACIG